MASSQPTYTYEPAAKVHKKRGPKPKPLSERVSKATNPITRPTRRYSRKRKIEVLMYLIHHRVAEPPQPLNARHRRRRLFGTAPVHNIEDGLVYRLPTYEEASAFWKIPRSTILKWYQIRDQILEGPQPRKKQSNKGQGQSDMEQGREKSSVTDAAMPHQSLHETPAATTPVQSPGAMSVEVLCRQ
ncbi:uncharacterized protein E0L32_007673 [Thyridium curvatum]|uniref:Uncharacterized protein n=1 Tax=Thyridium curvatum TaxID=1093900 RepID=A0A507AZ23_9PEZI|nr:uncharacterized protein E0L32_007673 [Thyridium curvatum]TPX11694.1 hypothetical protein E0L32_007673 [Thyridium curvatum]